VPAELGAAQRLAVIAGLGLVIDEAPPTARQEEETDEQRDGHGEDAEGTNEKPQPPMPPSLLWRLSRSGGGDRSGHRHSLAQRTPNEVNRIDPQALDARAATPG
jgi:hypothetical protein